MSTPHQPPSFSSELHGEYRQAMEAISVQLMRRLLSGEDLWLILGKTEALLLEAQHNKAPIGTLFGDGGIAGFCQSIIDEQLGGRSISTPALDEKKPPRRPRTTMNKPVQKRKRLVTVSIVVVWVLLVCILLAWYAGIFNYLQNGTSFYLHEMNNFDVESHALEGTSREVTFPLRGDALLGEALYEAQGALVEISGIGYDEYNQTSQETAYRHWWVELTYTIDASFHQVSYVSPAESGTSQIKLPSGEVLTDSLIWRDSDDPHQGHARVRLYFFKATQDLSVEGAQVTISFDLMQQVILTRKNIGIQ